MSIKEIFERRLKRLESRANSLDKLIRRREERKK